MTRAKGHHIVPRKYLEGFADERGMVTVVRFGQPTPSLESIRRAARETDFYTTRDQHGVPSDAMEDALQLREGVYFPGVAAAAQGWPLDSQSRQLVGEWVVLQFMRTQSMRALFREVGHLVVDEELNEAGRLRLLNQMILDHPEFDPERVREQGLEALDHAAQTMRAYAESAESHARSMDAHMSGLVDRLLKRRWILWHFDLRSVATSDSPVGLWSEASRSHGIGTADAVTFPVDRNRALVMVDEDGPDYAGLATTRRCRWFNQVTASNARRAIYYHPGGRPLTNVDIPTVPQEPLQLDRGAGAQQ